MQCRTQDRIVKTVDPDQYGIKVGNFLYGVDGLHLLLQYVVMDSSFNDTALTGLAAGRDYPRTYREFVEMYPDVAAYAEWLGQLRWPSGFICPQCGAGASPWWHSRGRLVCSSCRHQGTVTAGTLLDKTRTPLTTWFEAAWHLTAAKNGLSAKTLERTLGVRYRVAWTMLQRFRVAMVRSEREQLCGAVCHARLILSPNRTN